MENKKYIYSIFDESNDYIAHDVSHYYDNEFGEGGGVDKTFDIITKKIGFNEVNARYIIQQSPKFAIWLADSILKETMAQIKKYNDSRNIETPKEPELKKEALEDINVQPRRTNYSSVRNTYQSEIRIILDWLKHPLTEKQNLRELSFREAVDKARIFHEELKVLGGDVDFVEPEEHTIIKEYDEVDGVKYYWVLIPKNFCDVESGRMGHCGRTGSGNELISLRSIKPYGKGHTISDSHVTIAYGVEDGLFYQAKGKKNQKPAQKYHEYIFDLIKYLASDELTLPIANERTGEVDEYTYAFNGFGSEYDSKEDYDFEDMSKEEIKELYEIKPSIFDDFGGRIILYEADIIDERPSTTITIKKSAKDVEDLLDLGRDISNDFIQNVLTGDTYQYFDGSDSWGYYYKNAEDYVNELNENNTNAVIDKIVEITSLSKEVVEENGIEHYISGQDEDFEKDEFDDIIRSIASALNSAEQDAYVSYYYKQIESALEELGEVKYLNDEGVSIEIDLSDILSLSDISKYLKDLETNDLEDVFYEAISDGTIEKPDVRIDDRYSPYPKDINDYFDIDYFKKGGSVKNKVGSIKKKRKKVAKVMREFKKGKLHIGKSDKIVKDRKQAVAIALSEAGLSKKENGGRIEAVEQSLQAPHTTKEEVNESLKDVESTAKALKNVNKKDKEIEKVLIDFFGFLGGVDGKYEKGGVEIILLSDREYDVYKGTPMTYYEKGKEALELIKNKNAKKGDTSKVLENLLLACDILGKEIQLYPQPQDKSGLKYADLKEWYIRKGFEMREDGIMVRKPMSEKNLSELYHESKEDDSNPELVAAVEQLLGKPKEAAHKASVVRGKVKFAGGWIEALTFEEENFCVYVAEKFMGMEFDCEQKDCLKNIDKQKLKEKIISIKEQLSGDGLTIANSIIDKI